MITLSEIRLEREDGWTSLVCNIDFGGETSHYAVANNLRVSVKTEYEELLSTQTYDPFFILPLYMAMEMHTDLRICGKISKQLFFNMENYGKQILCDFSPELMMNNVYVDGFVIPIQEEDKIIGAGSSCGVDSMTTIYDRFICENDSRYKINTLFFIHYGTCGDYDEARTNAIAGQRLKLNQSFANELGLPLFEIRTNFHEFTHSTPEGGVKIGNLALYSAILALQKKVSTYYLSSSASYEEEAIMHAQYKNKLMADFCESYFIPLVATERMKIVLDGAQFVRTQKTERISGWDLCHKYLNVCVNPGETIENCSVCCKCMRTLTALEANDCLDDFKNVFNLSKYHKNKYHFLCECILNYGKDIYATDIINYRKNKMPNESLPTLKMAKKYLGHSSLRIKIISLLKRLRRRIL